MPGSQKPQQFTGIPDKRAYLLDLLTREISLPNRRELIEKGEDGFKKTLIDDPAFVVTLEVTLRTDTDVVTHISTQIRGVVIRTMDRTSGKESYHSCLWGQKIYLSWHGHKAVMGVGDGCGDCVLEMVESTVPDYQKNFHLSA